MLRVGLVNYLNALPLITPFQLNLLTSNTTFTYATPSQLNTQLTQAQLDLSFSSSIQALSPNYTYLSSFGMIANQSIQSVNLYTKKPLHTLNKIAITSHTATSVTLLRLLCTHHWKISPTFTPLDDTLPLTHHDAFLLIGDRALECPTLPHYQTIDLATAWYEMTGLPFVFALFAYPKNTSKIDAIASFEEKLELAYQWSQSNRRTLLAYAQKRSTLHIQILDEYFSLCQYRLNASAQKGLSTFYQMVRNNHVPLFHS